MNKLAQLRSLVLGKQEVLAEIYNSFGRQSIADYTDTWRVAPAGPENAEFAGFLRRRLSAYYPAETVEGVVTQFLNLPLLSTIDHLGVLGHPFFLNSNLIFAQRRGLNYLLSLGTAGVSLNNSSWPGSIVLNDDDGNLRRWSLFADKLKMHPVLAAPAIDRDSAERLKNRVGLTLGAGQEFTGLFGRFFNEEIFALPDFSSQACKISTDIWSALFPQAPRLVYLPLEGLIGDILAETVAVNPNHGLFRLFFTPDGWNEIGRLFEGSLGAFTAGHKGSFLFWGLDEQGRRVQMRREQNFLVGAGLRFELSSGSLAEALRHKRLYPTSLVCFLVLLAYRVTCLGGFNQVNWLTGIKTKFTFLLGGGRPASAVAGIATDNFAEGTLAFGINGSGRLYKPSAWDLLAAGGGPWPRYRSLAQHLSLADSIDVQLPEIYRVTVPAAERDPALAGLTEAEVAAELGLEPKVRVYLAKA